jgi:hypothetical protein
LQSSLPQMRVKRYAEGFDTPDLNDAKSLLDQLTA